MTPVLAAPMFDPGCGRIEMDMPEGLSIEQIIARSMPDLPPAERPRCRVMLVSAAGASVVDPLYWHSVKPKPGVRVVIRLVPGKNALRSVLMIVVSVAAIALGGPFGSMMAGTFGLGATTWGAIGMLGINVLGSLLVNALIPPPRPKDRDQKPSYSISGWQNRFEPDGAVPVVLGEMRYAPPFAASSYTEIVGDWQYIRALFTFGHGLIDLSEMRLGETPFSEFDEIDVEIRQGQANDDLMSLYPKQVVEENIGVDLARPKPRDDAGEITSDEGTETPIVRTTGDDASGASIITAFPAGLVKMDDDGDPRTYNVRIRIQQRLAGTDAWALVEELDIRGKQTEAFFRQYSWDFPTRGRWEIRLTRMNTESTDSTVSDRAVWAGLQTLRPEYPLNFEHPLCLVALRIKATHQLNGGLDNFSAVARRICLDYDHVTGSWIESATSNPASLYRHVLQSPANPRPVTDAGIDLEQLEDWHDFCRLNGLTYNAVADQAGSTLRDILTEIAAAGRATPRHDGMRWGVTIDRPQDLIVDHISPRNSWNFRARRSYVEPPHGFRVKFQDKTKNYEEAERLIAWPGHAGPIELTELLEMPGKTDPDEVWIEARRRMLEAIHRPDSYEVMQDGPVRVATRGDLVSLSHDVLDDIQCAARAKAVIGDEIVLDEELTIEAGQAYGIRFRVFDGPADTVGRSVVRTVTAEVGPTSILTLTGAGEAPEAGDMILFGVAGRETLQMIVTGVEMTEDMACLIRLVDAAPQIDDELAAMVPPPWTGRVGFVAPTAIWQPPKPRFRSIQSGMAANSPYLVALVGWEAAQRVIVYQIEPGSGVITTTGYRVSHRLVGAAAWVVQTIPAANGGGHITGYDLGDAVEIKAQALAAGDVSGPETITLTVIIGSSDVPIPSEIDASGVTVQSLIAGARIIFDNTDPSCTQVQLYRSMVPSYDPATNRYGGRIAVEPGRQITLPVGDLTRTNILPAALASFDDDAWAISNSSWTIGGGIATHTDTQIGTISRPLALTGGKAYRIAFTAGVTSGGSIWPRLEGASAATVAGSARTAAGRWHDRIVALAGHDELAFAADEDFDGTLDDVMIFVETPTCLPAGTNYFWIEPINAQGVAGPVIGPFTASIE